MCGPWPVDADQLEGAYQGILCAAWRWRPPGALGQWDHHHTANTHGRVALVAGSSRGLAAVIARHLARDGFAVAVNGRPGDEQVAAIGRAICDNGGAGRGPTA
jgi:hypothetical protein